MDKKNVAKNYVYNLISQLLLIIMPIITTPYLSRVLGAENIGIYSYTISITTYFILFGSLGMSLYGQREIAYVQDDKKKRTKLFYEIFFLKLITLCFSLLFFYLTFCINGSYNFYYKILILEIIANILDISWFYQGLEDFKKTVLRNIVVKLVSVLCIFLFVKSGNDLTIYFIIYVLSTLLGNIFLWVDIPNYIGRIKFNEVKLIRHLKPTLYLFIPQIATQVYTVLDKTMIGVIISDKSEVGFYEQAQKIVKLLMTLATSLGTVMLPRIAATFASGNKDKIRDYMNKSFSFILLLAFPLMFGIISVSNHFVPIFFGTGYDKVVPLLCILSPIIILIGLSNVTGTQYLLPTKQQGKYTISVIAGAVVNFILNMVFIRIYKSIGAAIATVIAELTVTFVQFYLIRKDIKFLDVLRKTYKYIISSIIMFFASILLGTLIDSNFISIVVQVVASVIIYFVCLFLLKDEFLLSELKAILDRFKKKKLCSLI